LLPGIGAIALAALVMGVSRPAAAAPDACQGPREGWLREASAELHVAIDPVECSGARLRIRLSPSGETPLDVEVARTGNGFRQVGGVSLSPVMNGEWQLVPGPVREAFDGLARWIDAHGDRVVFEAPSGVTDPISTAGSGGRTRGAPWLLLGAIPGGVVAMVRGLAPLRRWALGGIVLFAAALALRAALGTWAPYHANGQGPMWVLAAAGVSDDTVAYGPGWVEVFHPLVRLFGADPERTVQAANVLFSAMVPPLALSTARLVGLSWSRATLISIAMLLDPRSIAAAATESYFNPVLALTAAGAALALAAVEEGEDGHGRLAAVFAVAMGCALAQAVRIHPIAWLPALVATAAPLASRRSLTPRRRLAWAAGLGVVSGVIVLASSGGAVLTVWRRLDMPPGGGAPSTSEALLFVLAVAVLAWRTRNRWLVANAALAVLAHLLVRHGYREAWLESLGRLHALMPLCALASALPEGRSRRAIEAAVATALLAAIAIVSPSMLRTRSVEQRESAWLRPWLRELPRGCSVAHLSREAYAVLYLPVYPREGEPSAPVFRVEPRHFPALPSVLGSPRCLFYVRGSICAREEVGDACDRLESQLDLVPVLRASFTPGPPDAANRYRAGPIETMIARVAAVRSARP
jgi:hypothetical protein